MNHSRMKGISFGFTSGIITTLGLMVGLHAGTHSKLAVIGGILTIAIADAFSDALGIHMSEESEMKHTALEIWESTLFTFFAKFLFAITFLVPVIIFNLSTAIIVSVIYGLTLLGIFSYFLSRVKKESALAIISEHLVIAFLVILITHYVGDFIRIVFK